MDNYFNKIIKIFINLVKCHYLSINTDKQCLLVSSSISVYFSDGHRHFTVFVNILLYFVIFENYLTCHIFICLMP